MTARYPMLVDVSRLRCVVIGGGPVAARKVRGILAAGGRVVLVAPILHPQLMQEIPNASIEVHLRSARESDVQGADLVFLATSDPEVNEHLDTVARAAGALVNRADSPNGGLFQVPAVIRRGDLTVAISSGGRGPAFARLVREDLERNLSEEYVELLEVVAEARALVRGTRDSTGEGWHAAIDNEVRALAREGRRGEAVQRVVSRLRNHSAEARA